MTRSPRLSLRARLLAGLIAVTAVFLVIMGTVSTFVISGHLSAQFDDTLLAAVGETPAQLKASPAFALAGVGPRGTVVEYDNGSPYASQLVAALDAMPLSQLRQHVRAHTVYPVPGTTLAAAGRRVSLGSGINGIMVVAAPRDRVAAGVRSLVIAELITGCALLAVLAAGGRWLIGRGLAPLNQMATTARRITTRGDLTARMPDPGDHAEVGSLADAINTMLDRIQQAFSARLHSEQKVRQFAADASHELRTPLTTIRGYAELYGQGALGPDQLPNAMRRIDEESQRMSRLVAELLELARLDRTSSLNLTETDLAVLVRDAAADASAVEPGRPVQAEAPDRLVVVADEPRIRQVLANLLGNVREHTPPGTPVALRLSPAGGGALIEVADAGPGMLPEDAARAFDRFHRGAQESRASTRARTPAGPRTGAGSGCRSSRRSRPRTTVTRIWCPLQGTAPGCGCGCRLRWCPATSPRRRNPPTAGARAPLSHGA